MAAGALALFWYEFHSTTAAGAGHSEALSKAQTMAVTTVIFFQIFYLFNCRSLKGSMWSLGLFSNGAVYLGIGVLMTLQVAFVHWSVMNDLFASSPLDAWSWAKSALAGGIVVPVIAVEKWWRSRRLSLST
jgi:Ca2+-transporting ATPase